MRVRAFSLSQLMRPTPMGLPSGAHIRTMSSFSKSPSMAVTPMGNRLTARCESNRSAAPALMCSAPLANPSEWAIHFLTLDVVLVAGRKRVQSTGPSSHRRSVRMLSRLPLAMITSMPSWATLRAMLHLVSMPPRPNDDFPTCMYLDNSERLSAAISVMTRLSGSSGFPS